MKGIVFEVVGDRAVVLKNDGGFTEIPAQKGWQTGDVVTLRARRVPFPAIIAVAACAALVFASLLGVLAVSRNQAALISIDINPSIEISVNRFGKVVSTEARNEEGAALLDALDLDGMAYGDAVLLMVDGAARDGYLAESGLLVFSVQAGDEALQAELLAALRTSADGYLATHHDIAEAEYYGVDGQTVEDAHRHGVTAGKYKLLLELESLDAEADIGAYAHHGVADIRDEISARHRHRSGGTSGDAQPQAPSSGSVTSGAQSPPSPEASDESQPQPEPASPPGGSHGGEGRGGRHGGRHE